MSASRPSRVPRSNRCERPVRPSHRSMSLSLPLNVLGDSKSPNSASCFLCASALVRAAWRAAVSDTSTGCNSTSRAVTQSPLSPSVSPSSSRHSEASKLETDPFERIAAVSGLEGLRGWTYSCGDGVRLRCVGGGVRGAMRVGAASVPAGDAGCSLDFLFHWLFMHFDVVSHLHLVWRVASV
jgi:hypothetical protein